VAYQNVGTPRFYVDHGLWLYTLGVYTPEADQIPFVQLNPSNVIVRSSTHVTVPRVSPINYIAFLGTRDSTAPIGYWPMWWDGTSYGSTASGFTEIVNCNGYDQNPESYDGFSMATFDDNPTYTYTGGTITGLSGAMDDSAKCGAISIGSTYQMPHSPELNLTMTREMDGVKRVRTKGGADLVNHKYIKPAMWGDAGAWELYSGAPANQALSRTGRRVWDLSFNYLQNNSVFAPTESQTSRIFDTSGYDDADWYYSSSGDLQDHWHSHMRFLAHDDFYTQVIHKTAGGLRFIFQPDSNNNNPDQFAICKFDKKFQFKQVANGVYNMKLKIREVW